MSARILMVGLSFCMVLCFSMPISATSYVLVDDARLAEQAEIIAWVEVVGSRVSLETGKITTVYDVLVEDVIKGFVAGSSLQVRVLGGETEDGRGLLIWGAPRFSAGQRLLVFLRPKPDGSYSILHFNQGAFERIERKGEAWAVRRLADARQVSLPGRPAQKPGAAGKVRVRRAEDFTGWLRDQTLGIERPANYREEVPQAVIEKVLPKFSLLSDDEVLRWFEFDSGMTVTWHRHEDGQPGLVGGGAQEFNRARVHWNNEPNTPVRLILGGTTTSTEGFGGSEPDDFNTILFTDVSDDIEEDFSCQSGGTLAVGGVTFVLSAPRTWKGRPARAIFEGEIVINNGVSCFADGNSSGVEELYTHELGHTLGLGHSCGDDETPACGGRSELDNAVMRAFIHDNGRGGTLQSDDIAGLRFLYDPNFTEVPCQLSVGHPNYCRDCGPCSNGQGDCDRDSDCTSGLVCGEDLGPNFGFGPAIDVCVSPGGGGGGGCNLPLGHPNYCRDCGPCGDGQGDCDRDSDCTSGLTCADDIGAMFGFGPSIDVCVSPGGGGGGGGCNLPLGHPNYCRDCGPCSNGQGDCDRDSDCTAGLTCTDNVGAQFGFGPNIDVCVGTGGGGGSCPWPLGHPNYCRDCGPCTSGQGDCDRDSDCTAGLSCVDNVGAEFGFGPAIDVCR